jgi:hypothetical protein
MYSDCNATDARRKAQVQLLEAPLKNKKNGVGQQSQTSPSSTAGLFMCSNQPRLDVLAGARSQN